MELLLDTHVLHWWLDGDARLSQPAASAIGNPSTRVFVSAASAWEITTKVRIGKLPGAVEVAERFVEIIRSQDFDPLPISAEHARQAGLMPGGHRNPFDRMLIAQSQIEGLTLVSNETLFERFMHTGRLTDMDAETLKHRLRKDRPMTPAPTPAAHCNGHRDRRRQASSSFAGSPVAPLAPRPTQRRE